MFPEGTQEALHAGIAPLETLLVAEILEDSSAGQPKGQFVQNELEMLQAERPPVQLAVGRITKKIA